MFAYNGLRAYYDCVFHPIWSLLPKSTTNARFLYGPISHCHLALLLTEKRRLAHPLRVSWWSNRRAYIRCFSPLVAHWSVQTALRPWHIAYSDAIELVYVWAFSTPLVWPHNIRPFIALVVFFRLFLFMTIWQCVVTCSCSTYDSSCSLAWYHISLTVMWHATEFWSHRDPVDICI